MCQFMPWPNPRCSGVNGGTGNRRTMPLHVSAACPCSAAAQRAGSAGPPHLAAACKPAYLLPGSDRVLVLFFKDLSAWRACASAACGGRLAVPPSPLKPAGAGATQCFDLEPGDCGSSWGRARPPARPPLPPPLGRIRTLAPPRPLPTQRAPWAAHSASRTPSSFRPTSRCVLAQRRGIARPCLRSAVPPAAPSCAYSLSVLTTTSFPGHPAPPVRRCTLMARWCRAWCA